MALIGGCDSRDGLGLPSLASGRSSLICEAWGGDGDADGAPVTVLCCAAAAPRRGVSGGRIPACWVGMFGAWATKLVRRVCRVLLESLRPPTTPGGSLQVRCREAT